MSYNSINITSSLLSNPYQFISKYSNQICWTVSFVMNRFISKAAGESYKDSGLSAIFVGTAATIDIALRYSEYVSTYSITYGALTASYVLPIINNIIHENNIQDHYLLQNLPLISHTKKALSLLSGIAIYHLVNQGYLTQSITPLITSAINYKIYGLNVALPVTIVSILEEFLIHYNITNSHHFSLAAISAATIGKISSNLYPNLAISGSVLISGILSNYGNDILENFVPIKSTKQTYNILLELSNNTYVTNMNLETLLVNIANNEFSSAMLYMENIKILSEWGMLLSQAQRNEKNFPEIFSLIKRNILFCTAYIFYQGIIKNTINSFSLLSIEQYFEESFYINKVLKENNIILLSKNNISPEKYSKDLSIIINNHINIYKNIISSLPSLLVLGDLGNKILIIPVLAVIDLSCTELLSKITTIIQNTKNQLKYMSIVVDKIAHYDLENANSLVQSDALGYKINQWQNWFDNINNNNLYIVGIQNVYNSVRAFKGHIIDYKGVSLLILFLQHKGFVPIQDILKLSKVIKELSDLLLIKSNSKLDLD